MRKKQRCCPIECEASFFVKPMLGAGHNRLQSLRETKVKLKRRAEAASHAQSNLI